MENAYVMLAMLFGKKFAENAQVMLNHQLMVRHVFATMTMFSMLRTTLVIVDAIFLKIGLIVDVYARVDIFPINKHVDNVHLVLYPIAKKLHVFVLINPKFISMIPISVTHVLVDLFLMPIEVTVFAHLELNLLKVLA